MSQVTIVVPSYRRPDRLAASLEALARQSRRPDETVVVCRSDDAPTHAVVDASPRVTRVDVAAPGVLAAMRAGAQAAHGDCIGFVDDDAEPHADWLEGVMHHLVDPTVGAVGGRDIVTREPESPPARDVGRITASGKLIGNHHLGEGLARDVDVLKAANMVFRRPALALPDGLRGEGAQVHFEVATSLWAKDRGWRLVYDPALAVDHLPAPRFDDDARGTRSQIATANAAFNYSMCLFALKPQLRARRLAYGLLAGDKGAPGLLRAARAVLERDSLVVQRLVPSIRGQLAAHRVQRQDRDTIALYTYPSPGTEIRWRSDATAP
jgi:GT2 family glycosyltransferase